MREWIYGRNPVYETLRAGRRSAFRLIIAQGTQEKGRLAEILQIAQHERIPIEQVQRGRLDAISDGHQGVSLEVGAYPYCALQDIQALAEVRSEHAFLLILDALQDPQNLGTLLRTAEGVGVHGVLLPLRHAVTVTPAVVNASSGASEHLLIAQVNLAQAIQSLKEAGVWVIGLEGGVKAERIDQVRLDGPLALVVGSEGQGLRSLTRASCDVIMQLPMRGRVTSLNAAVAGSIALYFAWQSRKFNLEG
jgi:23S rRNA (guanosine2251-2'-O)-methyltransferase